MHTECWNFRSKELSLPELSWNFHSLELSLPGTKVPWKFRSLELSLPGTFVSFHELSLSELNFLIGLTIVNINVR